MLASTKMSPSELIVETVNVTLDVSPEATVMWQRDWIAILKNSSSLMFRNVRIHIDARVGHNGHNEHLTIKRHPFLRIGSKHCVLDLVAHASAQRSKSDFIV
jgi:hypothetical protein